MKLSNFFLEIPKHYDDLFHPTTVTSPLFRHRLDGVLLPQLRNINHLLHFALSLLEHDENYLLVTADAKVVAYAKRQYPHIMFDLLGVQRKVTPPPDAYRSPFRGSHGVPSGLQNPKQFALKPRSVGVCFCKVELDVIMHGKLFYLIEPYLANRSLILINDANSKGSRTAVYQWVTNEENLTMLYDIPTPYPGYPTWDNGIQLLAYERKRRNLPGR